jgi:hypothetical protein
MVRHHVKKRSHPAGMASGFFTMTGTPAPPQGSCALCTSLTFFLYCY